MRDIEVCVDALLDSIQKSNIYQRYLECETEISKDPGLKKQIDDLRAVSYQMHQKEDWFDASDRLEEQFAELQKIPQVNAYLEAELDLCKVIQKVTAKICGSLDLKIPQM